MRLNVHEGVFVSNKANGQWPKKSLGRLSGANSEEPCFSDVQ